MKPRGANSQDGIFHGLPGAGTTEQPPWNYEIEGARGDVGFSGRFWTWGLAEVNGLPT